MKTLSQPSISALLATTLVLAVLPVVVATAFGAEPPPISDTEKLVAAARFKVVEERYRGAGNDTIFHAVYLPSDWKPDQSYPVIVEYPGNKFAGKGWDGNVMQLSGLADSAHMGFYLAGDPGSAESGKGAIWVVMPLIRYDPKEPLNLKSPRPAPTWWGCRDDDYSDAAINDVVGQGLAAEYLRQALPGVCQRYGGDPKRVVLAGFSRGAIAGGWIGRADDATAALFCGFVLNAHHDGSGKPLSPADPEGIRARRGVGSPSLLLAGEKDNGRASTEAGAAALRKAGAPVELRIIPDIPHTDEWLYDRNYTTPAFRAARDEARTFLHHLWDLPTIRTGP
jgi:acetyl esterase/lipase